MERYVGQAEFTNYIQPCPKWEDAASIWYTDGSATKSKIDGTMIGSRAYCRGKNVSLRIAPCGDGPCNTITRAQLVATYAVLCHVQADVGDCIIATDRKASMQAIHKHIHNPRGNQLNTHKTLLDAIAAELHLRALRGLHTSTRVKSHIGIVGNEMADKLANEAQDAAACDLTYDIGNQAHQGKHWPVLTAWTAAPDQSNRQWVAGDLHAAIKGHTNSHHAKGLTNNTLYVRVWEGIRGDLHKSSHSFWSAPQKTLRNVLLARFGGLSSQNLAHRYGHAQDINCPLCNLEDGAGHMLGGCAHRDMRALYIERHNAAGRQIAKNIRNGAHGNQVKNWRCGQCWKVSRA